MLWTVDPTVAANTERDITIRNLDGKAVTAPVSLETALELVNEHNAAVYRVIAAGLGMKERPEG